MVLATEDAAFSIDENMPFNGVRSIFCPNNSNFSGSTIESVNCGVPIMPSSNLICTRLGLRTSNLALVDTEVVAKGPENLMQF